MALINCPNFLWSFGSKERVGGVYEYSFQAQEHDDEIKGIGNSINYKYRMHDTRLGRFFAVDPLAAKYPWNSPYAFSENDLIRAVELEGQEKRIIIYQDLGDGKTRISILRVKENGVYTNLNLKDSNGNEIVKNQENTLVIHRDKEGNITNITERDAKYELNEDEKLVEENLQQRTNGRARVEERIVVNHINGKVYKSKKFPNKSRYFNSKVFTDEERKKLNGNKRFKCSFPGCDAEGTFEELENVKEGPVFMMRFL